MTQDALAAAAANTSSYVRFEDMESDTVMTKVAAKVVDVMSYPWLWVAVGIAAVCELTVG